MSRLLTQSMIAGITLCLFSADGVFAASAANEHVQVSCGAPQVEIVATSAHFDVFAPGYPDGFVTNVMVTAVGGWELVKPTASDLPLKMKGGDTESYAVTREPEDEVGGTIAFHNYHIKSNRNGGAKYIGVATGESVAYTAYKNGGTCPSDRTVDGPDFTEAKNNTPDIIFNRSWWQIPDWFIPSINTPKPGAYAIDAQDVKHAVLKDNGEMAVLERISSRTAVINMGLTTIPTGNRIIRIPRQIITGGPKEAFSAEEIQKCLVGTINGGMPAGAFYFVLTDESAKAVSQTAKSDIFNGADAFAEVDVRGTLALWFRISGRGGGHCRALDPTESRCEGLLSSSGVACFRVRGIAMPCRVHLCVLAQSRSQLRMTLGD